MPDKWNIVAHMLRSQASSAVLTISSIAVIVLLTRIVSVETFGQYSILVAFVAMFTRFAGLNVYFYYRNSYPTASYARALEILKSYLPVVILLGLGISAVFVFVDLGANFLPAANGVDYLLWAGFGMLSLLNLELMRFYQSIGRNVFGNWLGTAPKVASVAIFCLCILFFGDTFDLRAIMVVLMLAQLTPMLLQFGADPAFWGIVKARRERFDAKAIRAGILIIPTAVFYDSLVLFDRLAISGILSYEAAGHYGLASQAIMMGYSILGGSLITMFYPRLVRARDTGQAEEIRAMIRLVFLAGGGMGLLGAAAVMAFAGLVPVIFGSQYTESVAILQAMSFVPLALFILSALAHIAYLYDDLRLSVACFGIGAIEFGILNYTLVPYAGITGAVTAIYITLLSMIIAHLLILLRNSSAARRELLA